MDEHERQQLLIAQLKDPKSSVYQNLMKILRQCDADNRRSAANAAYVGFPFPLEAADQAALELQFGVKIKTTTGVKRMPLTDRVAGMLFLLDAALLEHGGGVGRDVVIIDGDVMTAAVCGVDGIFIERSNATARLASGYHLENEALHRYSSGRNDKMRFRVDMLHGEVVQGFGEHFSATIRSDGPPAGSILVNHFKTPVGAHQIAYLAKRRAAVVYGCIPFQPDMLTADEGDLDCFPGRFYIDRELDAITLVPRQEASMSVSIPYSAWYSIVSNNTVTVDNLEFLCEKYNSVKGVLYYTMNPINQEFEAPEVLRTNYYDCKQLGVTEISLPKVKFSAEGVPIGWERRKVRIFTDRLEKAMSRLMCSANSVITPAEAFNVLTDYNNTVVNSMDTTTLARRMNVDDQIDVAMALALHTNWTRHNAKATFGKLLGAVKLKYDLTEASIPKIALVALHTWWSSPSFSNETLHEEIPVPQIVDWLGNDFTVLMNDAEPWIEFAQEAGLKQYSEAKYYDFFPRPVDRSSAWFKSVMERVRAFTSSNPRLIGVGSKSSSGSSRTSSVKGFVLRKGPVVLGNASKSVVATPSIASIVNLSEVELSRPVSDLTDLKKNLMRKMTVEQGAYTSSQVLRRNVIIDYSKGTDFPKMPVVEVEPMSAINDDLLVVNKGPFESLGPKAGYRLAETEISKNITGSFMINDSKRLLPKDKFVRLPKVDAGVEGSRAASQMSLFGALCKRNLGVPNNRGAVDLDSIADVVVSRMIDTCYRTDWQEILEKHLENGLWDMNTADIENFLVGIDEKKSKALLNGYFSEGLVELDKWQLFAKPGVKPGREPQAQGKIDHAQTIMFLKDSSVNAAYSAQIKHLKECMDECLLPNIHIIPQCSDEEQERWYNSLDAIRDSHAKTFSYGSDIRTFDRSQELVARRLHMRFYERHGLGEERLKKWESMYGVKKASSMMLGIVIMLSLGGISGVFDTIFRNSIQNWGAVVVSAGLERKDIVMMDIKGDDMDLETSRPIEVEQTVERMSLTFNFSAKFYTNDIRYYCKQFRVKARGRWYQLADPWARVQSLCKPVIMGNNEDELSERYISLKADLRHYDDGYLVDLAAECAQVYYGLDRPLYGMARGLAMIAQDKNKYYNFFHPAVRVN